MLRSSPPLDPETRVALERVIATAGPLMASVSGFERRLAEPIQVALKYCDDLIATLPGMIDINRRAFALDPLVHAFFATPQDIEEMLGRSQTLREYLADPHSFGSEHFHALFAARRREKHVVGLALQGEILRQDVPQTLLYFSSQTLTAVAADLQATRDMLRAAAFDSLLQNFVSRADAMRLERQGFQGQCDLERARLKGLQGSTETSVVAEHQERLSGLELSIRTVTESLQPDRLVDALAEFLNEPERVLRLEPVKLQVDRNGVIADTLNTPTGREGSLYFPELVGRDRRRYVVMLARIPREEAERAVAKILDQQRRFILI
ncbi:MAG: hypothetical protein NT159_17645 [Proteobacteria bacterium]|nr:hypothetical protein [Pseudomonadota bacterium]